MKIIKHRFLKHEINPETEILIIGTFNPDTDKNPADFFYGRNRNFLWRLLSTAFDLEDLKGKSKEEKTDFIKKEKIDFIDLIAEVEIDEGKEANYADVYIDGKVSKWQDIINEIKKLSNLRKVCFTRRSFADIPEMKMKIGHVKNYCLDNKIDFQCLTTPARFYRDDKQQEWTKFFKI
jgi:G:T/U-mismatch repair DNA glycosylase